MKQLNYCSACYDYNTLISYSTLIFKRTPHYTFVYRYHSATTTQHFYKFCDKIGIESKTARALWNDRSRTHAIIVVPNDGYEFTRYYYQGTDLLKDRDRFAYPDEIPTLGYGIIDR